MLTKFIDGTGALPVHLHADDDTARRLDGEPHGKTEAWHVLDTAPGATARTWTIFCAPTGRPSSRPGAPAEPGRERPSVSARL
ncbi:hypothetical protein [Streptomyces sp. SA15]|uniref:hypothetical protein n=1 Tax=Streptomyces sp. SA15 TaxID=934019 RepID=UPI0027BB1C2D|nr:hypothetical protein [Streptomyces sp. SA15]